MNIRPFLLLFFSSLLASCGGVTTKEETGQRPEWLTDLEKACPSHSLCAVGEGETMTQAKIRGRSELAKIFEVRIQSEVRHQTEQSEEGQLGGTGHRVETESYVSRDLKEVTDQVLEEAQTKKHHLEENQHYALVGVKKGLVRDKYESLLRTVDEKLRQNFHKDNRYGLIEAKRLWPKRRAIARKLAVVGTAPAPPVTWGDIQHELDALPQNTVLFDFEAEGVSQGQSDLKEFIEKELHRLRFRVVSESSYQENPSDFPELDYELKVDLRSKEVPFNVDGFKRFRFTLTLSAKNVETNVQVGSLEVSKEENGRHFQQALNKTQGEWKSYIEDNIHRLNMN